MHLLSPSVFALALAIISNPTSAQISPFKPVVPQIQDLTTSGPGCPPGTAKATINLNKSAITISFYNYAVKSGPSIPISENKSDCRVQIPVKIPRGWQYQSFRSDISGTAFLTSADVKAVYKSTQSFVGLPNRMRFGYEEKFDGPKKEIWDRVKALAATVFVPSICGGEKVLEDAEENYGALQFDTELRVESSGSGRGDLVVEDVVVYLSWNECTPEE